MSIFKIYSLKPSPRFVVAGLGILTLLAGMGTFLHYFLPDLNVWLSLLALPFVLYFRQPNKYSWRFAIFSALFLGFYVLTGMKFNFLLGTAFAILFLLEQSAGKLNSLPVLLIFILSPVPHYLATVLGFPLRLWLSRTAGGLLSLIGMEVDVQGNVFVLQGEEFAVDPACAGIGLFVTGLVLMVILLSYQEKRQGRSLGLGWLALILSIGTILIVFANLMRIIATVLLRIAPDNVIHDLIGMFCAGLYFLLPIAIVISFLVRKKGRLLDENWRKPIWRPLPFQVLSISLVFLLTIAVLNQKRSLFLQNPFPVESAQIELHGFSSCITETGVVALHNSELLIYLKPPVPFYGPDHYPEICWTGGGYVVRAPERREYKGHPYFFSRLENEEEQLYTAWWYDNGLDKTTDQLDWRWRQLMGAPGYHLVNLTAADPETLECWLAHILINEPLQIAPKSSYSLRAATSSAVKP